ncbi:MAG TPA: hypothetical protein VFM48_08215 [Aquabacterium sp.]|nr:hypothetical protein [Aquabacterium sp.]
MGSTPQFIATVKTPTLSIANADGTTFKNLYTAGTSGGRIDAVSIANSDVSNAYTVQFAVSKSGVDYPIGEVAVPAGSGTNGTALAVSALSSVFMPFLDVTESNALFLESGVILRAKVKSTVAGANTLSLVGFGGDY